MGSSRAIQYGQQECPKLSREALAALIEGTEAFLQTLADNGISIKSGGGETAGVGDLTGTVAVDSCAVAGLSERQGHRQRPDRTGLEHRRPFFLRKSEL